MAEHNATQLDEATITKLINSPEAQAALPFLKKYAHKATGKKGCGCGAGNRRQAAEYGSIKRVLAEMSGPNKEKLKALLGVKAVRIRYKSAGADVERTF